MVNWSRILVCLKNGTLLEDEKPDLVVSLQLKGYNKLYSVIKMKSILYKMLTMMIVLIRLLIYTCIKVNHRLEIN